MRRDPSKEGSLSMRGQIKYSGFLIAAKRKVWLILFLRLIVLDVWKWNLFAEKLSYMRVWMGVGGGGLVFTFH